MTDVITYVTAGAGTCEGCGSDAPVTYRIAGDTNGAYSCGDCAAEYVAREYCAQVWIAPADAWAARASYVMTYAAAWYPGGLAALRRDFGIGAAA